MCGIHGVLGQVEYGLFEKALHTLTHRGPDGYGIWNDDRVFLGHRRLSIIDLSDAASQPMHYLDRYTLIFNGEIYNYKELKKELQLKGYIFNTSSDTEVLMAAFHEWKHDCLPKLNGMWALAIWDKQTKELFISRDRMGKKPFFYSAHQGKLIFGSEMKCIYPYIEVNINQDLVKRAKANVWCYESTSECLIENIYRFPAGSYAYIKNWDDRIEPTRFWKPETERMEVPERYEEQVELFRELFLDSCKIRMRSDVKIGTALSGGLDSSATISAMAHLGKMNLNDHNTDWQHAFIASFPGAFNDETVFGKEVSNYLNIPSEVIKIDPLKDIDNIYKLSYYFEELYLTDPIPFAQLYGKIKSSGITVSIDGHGGDELFAGYPFDVIVALQDNILNPRKYKEILDTFNGMQGTETSAKDYTFHSAKIIKNKLTGLVGKSKLQKNIHHLDSLNSRLFESTYTTILPTLLRNYDRYSMISGVEIRMPFLDYRIVQFAFSIPWSSKVRNGYSKAIVRDALHDLMPESIAYRKHKIGLNSPMQEWMTHQLKGWFQDTVNSSAFQNSSVVNASQLKQQIMAATQNKALTFMEAINLWQAFMPYVWEQSLSLRN
jgi:asparagine synthase (glutamine-hydrolysing)